MAIFLDPRRVLKVAAGGRVYRLRVPSVQDGIAIDALLRAQGARCPSLRDRWSVLRRHLSDAAEAGADDGIAAQIAQVDAGIAALAAYLDWPDGDEDGRTAQWQAVLEARAAIMPISMAVAAAVPQFARLEADALAWPALSQLAMIQVLLIGWQGADDDCASAGEDGADDMMLRRIPDADRRLLAEAVERATAPDAHEKKA